MINQKITYRRWKCEREIAVCTLIVRDVLGELNTVETAST